MSYRLHHTFTTRTPWKTLDAPACPCIALEGLDPYPARMADDTYSSIDDALANMADEHMHCRDYGHAWRRHTARYVAAHHVYERTLKCSRCGTLRNQWINERGDYVRSGYDYPDHYVIKGVGRMTADHRAAVRLATVMADTKVTKLPTRGRGRGRRSA